MGKELRGERKRMNRRGMALVFGLIIIMVLTILGSLVLTRSISERQMSVTNVDSAQAFWVAEAGLARAIQQLPTTTALSGSMTANNKTGTYTTTTALVTGYTSRYQIDSIATVGGASRHIQCVVDRPLLGTGANSITVAVESTGTLTIKGSCDINPDGSYRENSSLDFAEVFGASESQIKSIANYIYTDPPNNQQPVSGITWIDLTGTTEQTATTYKVTSSWTGSGMLIVDGNRNTSSEDVAALEISGDWTFNGMIWVMGKVKITGNPVITGGLFAETAVDVDSTLSGNGSINFSTSTVQSAFTLLSGLSSPTMVSWKEI